MMFVPTCRPPDPLNGRKEILGREGPNINRGRLIHGVVAQQEETLMPRGLSERSPGIDRSYSD
jgi:hypothetical protein